VQSHFKILAANAREKRELIERGFIAKALSRKDSKKIKDAYGAERK
jgi:hypothetical protein